MTTHTELTAINELLGIAGEAPVSEVDSPLPLAQQARDILRVATGDLQSDPFWFNDYESTLTPDEDGHIPIGDEVTSVSCVTPGTILVVRGNRLHNLTKDTPIFEKAIKVRLRLSLPFEQLPNIARLRVVALAKVKMAEGTTGEEPEGLERQLRDTRARLNAEDIRQRKVSFLTTDSMQMRRAYVQGWRRDTGGWNG